MRVGGTASDDNGERWQTVWLERDPGQDVKASSGRRVAGGCASRPEKSLGNATPGDYYC